MIIPVKITNGNRTPDVPEDFTGSLRYDRDLDAYISEDSPQEIIAELQAKITRLEAKLEKAQADGKIELPSDDDMVISFAVGIPVQVGQVVEHGGVHYTVRIAHTTQSDWSPDRATTLWTRAPEQPDGEISEWSSFASHEFQTLPIGTAVMDNGTVYYLINQGQGFRQPSGPHGHFGWSTTKP
jgi:hypothetical protein